MSSIQRRPDEVVISLIPLGVKTLPSGERSPDVAIVTGLWGESFKSAARLAILVFLTDSGELEFANGVFAPQTDCYTLTMNTGWPELERVLGKKPKNWSPLFNPKEGFKPHTAVKNIYLGDLDMTLDEPEFGPAEALVVLASWNDWGKDNLNSAARHGALYEKMVPAGKSNTGVITKVEALTAQTNRFDKFCSELGLTRKTTVTAANWDGLRVAICLAIDINRQAISRE